MRHQASLTDEQANLELGIRKPAMTTPSNYSKILRSAM